MAQGALQSSKNGSTHSFEAQQAAFLCDVHESYHIKMTSPINAFATNTAL